MSTINKIIPTGIATLVILLAVAFSTSADEGDETQGKGPRFNAGNREAVMETVEKCDYDAWYNLLTEDGKEPPILETINEGNFERFCEMHELRQQAREIAEELGLPEGPGQRPELTDEQKAIMEQVIELKKAGDIEGAKALMEESDMPFGKAMGRRAGHWKPQVQPE